MTTNERRALAGRIQDLIGRARGDYTNDRAPDRAERVLASLDEAFDLAVRLNSSYSNRADRQNG